MLTGVITASCDMLVWRGRGGGQGAMLPNPGKNMMVGNGGPIIGCLIHRVTKYSGFQDACVRFFFPVLYFRKILS